MLCAASLAALEQCTPPTHRLTSDDDECSVDTTSSSSTTAGTSPRTTTRTQGSHEATSSSSTVPSVSGGSTVGTVRSERASGTDSAYDAAGKWVLAALAHLGKDVSDLMLPSHEPDDALASKVHSTITGWRVTHTTAEDAGVADARPHELGKCPPKCVLAKTRGWLTRHVNRERARHGVREVDDSWARRLAGVRADAREVNSEVRDEKARDGTMFHHKHDLAPTYDQVTVMCAIALTGDARVDECVLDAQESGMAMAIYFPTGARGKELKGMALQSIGYEEIEHEASGEVFRCLKLTAFECKSKEEHLNQFLASSNPWRCGVGGLGVSILLRVRLGGEPPPFTMKKDDLSWKVVSTSVGRSFDRRLNDTFAIAGVRRQTGDPLNYLGRHFGTRCLQHQGGSTEGGAARRGHTCGATFAYSECPLPDLLRLMGNDPTRPFVPAHLQSSLFAHADAVLVVLFPQLSEWRATLETRHGEVDRMRGKSIRVRSDEQLNDKERFLNGIEYACRVALLCLVARPRRWQRWSIMEESPTMWQRGVENRVVRTLFAQNALAIQAMNALAIQVRRCEESELTARRASPEEAVSNAVVTAVQEMSTRAEEREREMMQQQRCMFEALMSRLPTVGGGAEGNTSFAPPVTNSVSLPDLPTRPEEVATQLMAPPATVPRVQPLAGVREKRKPQAQSDVAHFSSHPTLRSAFEYARDDLYPLELAQGAGWRIRKREDNREDKSRDRQWRFYRQLAIAIGMRMAATRGDLDAAIDAVDAVRGQYPSLTAFNAALRDEQTSITDGDALARKAFEGDMGGGLLAHSLSVSPSIVDQTQY